VTDRRVAAPRAWDEDHPHWLVEVATCSNCGTEVQRHIGRVRVDGSYDLYFVGVEPNSEWMHSVHFVKICETAR
jgi:hypothetical protein